MSNKTYKTTPEYEENPLLADYDPSKYVTKRKKYMCYPQDKVKQLWDLISGIMLIISCLTVPFYLAIYYNDPTEKPSAILVNAVVDICFFVDILVTFNTAVYVSQVCVIEDRK